MSEIVVTGFATTPVKGMRIHEVDSIELSRSGARGNRAFYVIDDRGRMVNGKVVRNLQVVVPEYDPDAEQLTLTFPDGAQVGGRVTLGEPVQTQFFGRPRTAPEVIGPWAEAISAFFDRPLRLVAARTAVDRGIQATASIVSRGVAAAAGRAGRARHRRRSAIPDADRGRRRHAARGGHVGRPAGADRPGDRWRCTVTSAAA